MQDGTEHILNTVIRFANVVFYFLGSSSLWFSHISTPWGFGSKPY